MVSPGAADARGDGTNSVWKSPCAPTGDLVVVVFRGVASGRAAIEVDIPLTGIYTVTDDKIRRIEFFPTHPKALEAVGLRE